MKLLGSGAVVDLIDGKHTILRCSWLVQVPSDNPEPDFIEDCYKLVECGAKFRVHPAYPEAELGSALLCDNGHDRLSYEIEFAPYGPAWEREQMEERY